VTTIDELLEAARARLERVTPEGARDARDRGALLVDVRPVEKRRAEGRIPGAVVVDRNVLEWRLDPASTHRIPEAVDHDVHVIVVCSEGYQSSLAAATLQDLGLHRATDLAGGAQAWIAAGLPTEPELDPA
jgi:rhodanese-related sulfurtransferase